MVATSTLGLSADTAHCIEWDGNIMISGYGRICRNGKQYLAHRYVWEEENGPIPEGMNVCHHCDNPPCINIDHLFLGTHNDNVQDRLLKKGHHNTHKTHCPAGHELSGDNLFPSDVLAGRGRRCKRCHVNRNRARRASMEAR